MLHVGYCALWGGMLLFCYLVVYACLCTMCIVYVYVLLVITTTCLAHAAAARGARWSGLVRVPSLIARSERRLPLAAPRNAQCTTLALAGRGARAHSTVHSRSTQLSRAQGGRYARSKRAGHGHGTPGTGRHRHPARSGSALPRPRRGHWNFRRRSSPSRSSSR
jgi:hypothetical protein